MMIEILQIRIDDAPILVIHHRLKFVQHQYKSIVVKATNEITQPCLDIECVIPQSVISVSISDSQKDIAAALQETLCTQRTCSARHCHRDKAIHFQPTC